MIPPFDVVCIQSGWLGNDPEARRVAAVRQVEAQAGAGLIVLPELWPTGYFAFDEYEATAEPFDGPTLAALAGAARNAGAYLLLGSFIERSDDGLHNTAVLLAPDGGLLAAYRKIHVFGYGSREAELIVGGSEIVTVATSLGRIGVAVCYDLRFPELFRAMVDEGAELFVVPAAWPAARAEHWRLLVRARAVESQAYVIAVNGAGTAHGTRLGGHSAVVDPWGEVVGEAGEEPCALRATVNSARVVACRAEFPALADRRLRPALEIVG